MDVSANIGGMICDPEEDYESAHNFKILAANIKRIDEDFSINVFTKLFTDLPTDQRMPPIKFEAALISL